jgi:hypothetical protein
MNQLKQQLINFHKSRSILNGIIFKQKYIIISLLFLILITFIFNINIKYFKEIDIYDSNIWSILFSFVILYLTFIKFNVMIRIFNLFKSVKFIYNSIKQDKFKDIKIIASYYYIFNIFLIIISLIFINRLQFNLIYIDISPDYIYYSKLLSIILLVYYIITNLNKEFNINNQENIQTISMVINILILCTPVILLNIYYDKIMIFVENYNLKPNIIYCDSKEDLNFRGKLKDNPSVVITNNSNSIINNRNSKFYINTPKEFGDDNKLNKASSSSTDSNQEPLKFTATFEINSIKDLNNKFVSFFIKILSMQNVDLEFNDDCYNKFINKSQVKYKIDNSIIQFFKSNESLLSNL